MCYHLNMSWTCSHGDVTNMPSVLWSTHVWKCFDVYTLNYVLEHFNRNSLAEERSLFIQSQKKTHTFNPIRPDDDGKLIRKHDGRIVWVLRIELSSFCHWASIRWGQNMLRHFSYIDFGRHTCQPVPATHYISTNEFEIFIARTVCRKPYLIFGCQ